MSSPTRRPGLPVFIVTAATLLSALLLSVIAHAGTIMTANDMAIKGTDVVAYFTEGRQIDGTAQHATQWNGATWRFSSAENLAAFKAEPERYAPQFGGYCAWAVSRGYSAPSDPQAWKIVDDKLYLNYSQSIQRKWAVDMEANITTGHKNWPAVKKGLE